MQTVGKITINSGNITALGGASHGSVAAGTGIGRCDKSSKFKSNTIISGGTIITNSLGGGTINGGTITTATIKDNVVINNGVTATLKGNVTNNGIVMVFGTLDFQGTSWTNTEQGMVYKTSGSTINGLTHNQYTSTTNNYVSCGNLWVTGGTVNTDYSYDSATRILTIKKNTTISIIGTETVDRIIVSPNVIANITLDGVSIDTWASSACAFELVDTAKVNLTLKGSNMLKSGWEKASVASAIAKEGQER